MRREKKVDPVEMAVAELVRAIDQVVADLELERQAETLEDTNQR